MQVSDEDIAAVKNRLRQMMLDAGFTEAELDAPLTPAVQMAVDIALFGSAYIEISSDGTRRRIDPATISIDTSKA